MTEIQLVNKNDKIIGYGSRKICHKGTGLLHRAFSVFIFNKKGKLLIQKRSSLKKLWPYFWSDACSSHPKKGEVNITAAKRRLKEELGFTCRLKLLGKFQYQTDYKKAGAENEICSFFAGKYDGKIKPAKKEIVEVKWISLKKLRRDMEKNEKKYTPWLKIGVEKFKKDLTGLIK